MSIRERAMYVKYELNRDIELLKRYDREWFDNITYGTQKQEWGCRMDLQYEEGNAERNLGVNWGVNGLD
jgi:hypothetical protein